MWRAALLLLAASLAMSETRPRFKPLSSDMVNYINKINTTWKVIYFECSLYSPLAPKLVQFDNAFVSPLQAGHNFHNVDFSYVQKLCGTMLKGPKLPVM